MQSPVALERLQAIALFWVPQNDLVVGPAAREKLAVKTPGDAVDPIAAIVSNVSFTGNCSTPLPRLAGRGRRQNPYFNGFAYRR